MLTPILSPSACASCRLCCNFRPESRWELPALEHDCVARLRARNVCLVERPEGGETIALPEAAEGSQEATNCPLLDTSIGCTLPRAERPLECRLWPLRLMQDEAGNTLVTCYTACPALACQPHSVLRAFAESLRPLFLERARSFPASIRPLHPGYTILFTLKESE